MSASKRKNIFLNIVVYMLLIAVVVFTLIPIGWVFSTSVKPANEIFARVPRWIPNNVTFQNYQDVLFDSGIPNAFKNSFLVGLMSTFMALVLGGVRVMLLPDSSFGEASFFLCLC
ncbi:ABC transporter permease family protein [Novisyntrophococcus fermenticellae]|uniref:hypothetical protein n=1 Tax=Novisyntrophococcus fermenticellae TaxID=2068655 RepID=UPI001E43F84F|nr:hypothetical protein [Novisyntrophococcus fermenticellae]